MDIFISVCQRTYVAKIQRIKYFVKLKYVKKVKKLIKLI